LGQILFKAIYHHSPAVGITVFKKKVILHTHLEPLQKDSKVSAGRVFCPGFLGQDYHVEVLVELHPLLPLSLSNIYFGLPTTAY